MDSGLSVEAMAEKLGEVDRALRDIGQTARQAKHAAEKTSRVLFVRRFTYRIAQVAYEAAYVRLATALFGEGPALVFRDRLYNACEQRACHCPNAPMTSA